MRSCRLGNLVYVTSREDLGRRKFRSGSLLEASEKVSLTSLDRTVVAGWREETNGTANLEEGLYSPFRTMVLFLLAIEDRWYLMESSLYPLATI
jgi:hypothetical protein